MLLNTKLNIIDSVGAIKIEYRKKIKFFRLIKNFSKYLKQVEVIILSKFFNGFFKFFYKIIDLKDSLKLLLLFTSKGAFITFLKKLLKKLLNFFNNSWFILKLKGLGFNLKLIVYGLIRVFFGVNSFFYLFEMLNVHMLSRGRLLGFFGFGIVNLFLVFNLLRKFWKRNTYTKKKRFYSKSFFFFMKKKLVTS